MGTSDDVLIKLQKFSFKDIQLPIVSRSANFSHDIVENKYIYRDGADVESLGRSNIIFEYTIPFRNQIIKGGYEDLFPGKFIEFLNICSDTTKGTLIDPVLGEFDAKIISYSDNLDVNKRDGVDVSIQLETVPRVDNTISGPNIQKQISAIEEFVDSAVNEDVLKKANVQPKDARINVLDYTSGLIKQGLLYPDLLSAKLNDLTFRLNKISNALKDTNKKNQKVLDSLYGTSQSSIELSKTINSTAVDKIRIDKTINQINYTLNKETQSASNNIYTYIVKNDIEVSLLAAQLGMILSDFLKINGRKVKGSIVSKDTVVYYKKA